MYQKIDVKIWRDEKFINLSEDAKSLFLYILTSPHSNSLGLYVLPKGYIIEDMKWSPKRLDKPLMELLDKQLIQYDEAVRMVFIKNQLKHRPLVNPRQVIGAANILKALPKTPLFAGLKERLDKPLYKPLIKLLDKPLPKLNSKHITINKDINTNKEKEIHCPEEKTQEPIPFEEIISDLNTKAKKSFKHTTQATRNFIKARWNEGYRIEDFKKVNTHQVKVWGPDPAMRQYLRPETLYCAKHFDSYLNNPPINGAQSGIAPTSAETKGKPYKLNEDLLDPKMKKLKEEMEGRKFGSVDN